MASPITWPSEPTPADAKVSGLPTVLPYSMNSATVFTFVLGCTASITGAPAMQAMWVKSLIGW